LKKDLPPGQYIVMESGPGNSLRRRPLLVEGPPSNPDAQSPENILKAMERIAMIRAYGNLLKPETDPNELLRVLLQNNSRGGDVGLFRDGLELGQEVSQQEAPTGEAALLAQIAGIFTGGGQPQAEPQGMRQMKILAVQVAKSQRALDDRLNTLTRIVEQISARLDSIPKPTREDPETMREEEKEAMLLQMFEMISGAGAPEGKTLPETKADLAYFLKLANSQSGNRLRIALQSVSPDGLKAALLAFLEGREDLFAIYSEAINDFTK